MIRLPLVVALAAGTAACATAAPSDGPQAVLVDASKPEIREAIRAFVRDQDGPNVRAEPDSLLRSPVLTLRERDPAAGRAGGRPDARALRPLGEYRLHLAPDGSCWLARNGGDAVRLPDSARCARA